MTNIEKFKALIDDIRDFIILKRESKNSVNQKRILITGLPRSGTTWFGSMLNTKGNLIFHEPFINNALLWNWDIKIEEGENIEILEEIYKSIKYRKNWNRYQKLTNNKLLLVTYFHNFINKENYNILIKDPSLCYFLNSMKEFDFTNSVVIYRNPLSIIGSVYKNKWDPTERLKRIRKHPDIKLDNEKAIKLLEDLDNLDFIQKIALQTGILQSLMERNTLNSILVKYEDYATNPIENFKILFNKLNLAYSNEVTNYHKKLSFANSKSYSTHDVERKSLDFVEIYKKYLSKEQIIKSIEIYDHCNPNPKIRYF